MRPIGLSAILRCKNEEEFIVASVLSIYRIFDEIVIILNNSTDRTRELIDVLIRDHPKIRLLEYFNECASLGPGYYESVRAKPEKSLAKYFNWCVEQTSFSHVCKWDGDMIATPEFEQVRTLIGSSDVVIFDGYDVLGEHTTDPEPRIFKYDAAHARYVDGDFYEVLEHNYSKVSCMQQKCYLHVKLVKKEWINRRWSYPSYAAAQTGVSAASQSLLRTWIGRLCRRSIGCARTGMGT